MRTLTATDVVEIYQARIALEAEAAASAAAHRSALDLARLRHVHDEARQTDDPTRSARCTAVGTRCCGRRATTRPSRGSLSSWRSNWRSTTARTCPATPTSNPRTTSTPKSSTP
ncbi:FCD domain-containing protein [Streptomyces sp. M19]